LNLANQYEKLQTSLELTNNMLYFTKDVDMDTSNNNIVSKIRDVEKKLNEIRESNNLLIPIYVRNLFPVICNINIFSFIKKIEMYRTNLIIKMKDLRNEMRWIVYKWKCKQVDIFSHYTKENREFIQDKKRLSMLMQSKEKIKDELLNYKNAYSYIDEIFVCEIKNAENYRMTMQLLNYLCCRKQKKLEFKYSNPFIDEYIKFIFKE
jgi:hypothetical protein